MSKTKRSQPVKNPFEEDKIPIPGVLYFEFVMRKKVKLDPMDLELAYCITMMRRKQLAESIDGQIKKLVTKDKPLIIKAIENMVFTVHHDLVEGFYNALPLIQTIPNEYYKDRFDGAKLFQHLNHTVIIIDRPASQAQIRLEYIGMMWLARMATFDDGRDIIMCRDSFRCFCHMMIGLEMFDFFKKHPLLKEYEEYFSYANLTVVSIEYGMIRVPTIPDIDYMLSSVRCVPYWCYY